jgi:hypothetical protein
MLVRFRAVMRKRIATIARGNTHVIDAVMTVARAAPVRS